METPDQTVTATKTGTAVNRAKEVVAAYRILSEEDKAQAVNVKHLWSLAYSIVADVHRFDD